MDFKAYPLKFIPVYKDYLWGGRHLERFGRKLPEGIVAESWELSTHPDGVSIIANGDYAGRALPDYLKTFDRLALGREFSTDHTGDFPLLIKWIDAHQKLSVQVHPNDEYAMTCEHGQRGKNEMWYILDAEPGARIIYDVKPGIDRTSFAKAVEEGRLEQCLQSLEVFPGDVIEIPAGVVHGLGAGILLAEIQQSSNLTYRIYDYDRVDAEGRKRPLHIEKALNVINFATTTSLPLKRNSVEDRRGDGNFYKTLLSTPYFAVEKHEVHGELNEHTHGERFYIWMVLGGKGSIRYDASSISLQPGETLFIPAALGTYALQGDNLTLLKVYLPQLTQ
ncbi:MAG TPA: type I phosphomannose isomerase catalytic subunit [Bacillota bacterium]|nr:type I phosphomannose isomerase catalytic subunit [Bacillota bacterium]